MTRRIRPLVTALCLSLCFALAGITSALACPIAVAEWVICGDHGAKVVRLDAKGQPAKDCQTCPDCLTGPVLALLPDIVMPKAPAPLRQMLWPDFATAPRPQILIPVARGPPHGESETSCA